MQRTVNFHKFTAKVIDMDYGICSVPVSALRKESSHKSEMVSQQLFGEHCIIIDRAHDHWVKVRCSYDGYEGWCQEAHVNSVSKEDFNIQTIKLTGAFVTEIEMSKLFMNRG